ncbi:hypothetical protein IW262DRAFT_1558940 [Armillaria fumosa]|nr:hypothetical protein IW262DRAFT_1558940 [Armillaria fumosa]
MSLRDLPVLDEFLRQDHGKIADASATQVVYTISLTQTQSSLYVLSHPLPSLARQSDFAKYLGAIPTNVWAQRRDTLARMGRSWTWSVQEAQGISALLDVHCIFSLAVFLANLLATDLTLRCSPSPTAFSSKPKAATIIPRTCGEMMYWLPVSKGRGSGTYEPKMLEGHHLSTSKAPSNNGNTPSSRNNGQAPSSIPTSTNTPNLTSTSGAAQPTSSGQFGSVTYYGMSDVFLDVKTLASATAASYWAALYAKAGGLKDDDPYNVENVNNYRVESMTGNATISYPFTATRLNINLIPLLLGLLASVGLLLLVFWLFGKPIEGDSGIDAIGVLQIIWLMRTRPDLQRIVSDVDEPTVENLRESGMVYASMHGPGSAETHPLTSG